MRAGQSPKWGIFSFNRSESCVGKDLRKRGRFQHSRHGRGRLRQQRIFLTIIIKLISLCQLYHYDKINTIIFIYAYLSFIL